jgi:hypothetical protein
MIEFISSSERLGAQHKTSPQVVLTVLAAML